MWDGNDYFFYATDAVVVLTFCGTLKLYLVHMYNFLFENVGLSLMRILATRVVWVDFCFQYPVSLFYPLCYYIVCLEGFFCLEKKTERFWTMPDGFLEHTKKAGCIVL